MHSGTLWSSMEGPSHLYIVNCEWSATCIRVSLTYTVL